jgi:hypothetical protein
MKTLAPIFLTTYRRLNHLRSTVHALQNDPLARQSQLIVTSDGPRPGHEREVFAVRRYLESIDGFRDVELNFFTRNDRRQVWNVRRDTSERYGKYILLEEDCVPARMFLSFLNHNLELHKNDHNIFAVCGFLPPVQMINSEAKTYACRSFNAWGFATWHRSDSIVEDRLSSSEYRRLISSPVFINRVRQSYSPLLLSMVHKIQRGELKAFDVMAQVAMMLNNQRCVFPHKSLVTNIGLDGTGEHCGTTSKYEVEIDNRELEEIVSNEYIIDGDLDRRLAKFNGSNWKNLFRFYWKFARGKFKIREDDDVSAIARND